MPVVSVSLDSETYAKLCELAKESGVSVGEYVKRVIREHVRSREALGKDVYTIVKELLEKVRELDERLSRIEATAAKESGQVKVASKSTSSSPSAVTGSNTGSGNKVFCKRKSEIADLKAYVEKLESKGILSDWWEEGGDAVCFELKREVFTKTQKESS